MTKTDRELRKYVAALLKYAKSGKVFNPGFTTEQIPEIFKCTEEEFNMVHHGAGAGCCMCIGSNRYKVNVDHCNTLQSKFTDSSRTKWRLIIAAIALLVAIVGLLLNYYRNSQ